MRSDDRRYLLLWTLVMAGVIGAIAQTMLIGAVKASIDIPYCDCGFKEQEIVSQVWAEMVVQGAAAVMIYAAALLAAAGLVFAGILFGSLLPRAGSSCPSVLPRSSSSPVIIGWADVAGDLDGWRRSRDHGLGDPGLGNLASGCGFPIRDRLVPTQSAPDAESATATVVGGAR